MGCRVVSERVCCCQHPPVACVFLLTRKAYGTRNALHYSGRSGMCWTGVTNGWMITSGSWLLLCQSTLPVTTNLALLLDLPTTHRVCQVRRCCRR